ncbi:hypothetical protein DSECCO2_598570 [anaerobic digester metagenome]
MFVIQYYIRGNGFKPGTWEPFYEHGLPKQYATLDEVEKAFNRMALTADCRIAEEYTVTRYKAVKAAR